MLNVDELLLEITPEEPCGVNLEYDPLFLEFEQVLQGKPEVEYGSVVTQAISSDWKLVKGLALQLLTRTRDLRVLVPFSRALLHVDGFVGFSAGLSLIERLLASRWDSLHPQLDQDDGNDPTLRVNTLSTLVDFSAVLGAVEQTPVVASRMHGTFCLRDIDIITGERVSTSEGSEKPSMQMLDAAFLEAGQTEIEKIYDALDMAWNSVMRIEVMLTDRVGAAQALDFSPLVKLLKRARDFVQQKMVQKTDVISVHSTVDAQNVVATVASSGAITSSEDVVNMLEKMCAYYASHEPSSPIPLLLQRALRLIDKSFIEILQDLTPDGLGQVYQISGTQPE